VFLRRPETEGVAGAMIEAKFWCKKAAKMARPEPGSPYNSTHEFFSDH
jgi:hypothetical protein